MFRIRRYSLMGRPFNARRILVLAVCAFLQILKVSDAGAAISSSGDISPVPPAAGGAVVGPFRIGNVDVATMSITTSGGVSPLTNTNSVLIGETLTGIGIVNMTGFGSDWTLTTASADMTIGLFGAGSVNLSNFAFLSVNDDLFLAAQLNSLGEISISGFGTIVDVGDDAIIGQRGQAVIDISNGGRLITDQNIIGDEPAGDGRVIVQDQFSLWRTTNTMTIADAGRALLQILDGGRVETTAPSGNISARIANQAGSTGTVEVVGIGSIWQNALGMVVGEFGHGTLSIKDGGRVSIGTGVNIFTIGGQIGSVGHVEVSGPDSLLTAATTEVGDSGDGTLRILAGGRVTSGNVLIGDNANSRGDVLVDGDGSSWEIAGDLNIADPSDGSVTISNGGRVSATSEVRVTPFGRLTLDGGRLEFDPATPLLNTGVVQGNGVIDGSVTNNASGLIMPWGAEPLVIMRGLTNSGLVDIQSGELEVLGATNNNSDIDARDGAILRFRANMNNNSGSQLAITSGVVDIFGLVNNNSGAEIAVGGTAVGVFHDAVTNSGTIFVQPGGEIFMLENLGFTPGSGLSIELEAVDLADPDSEPSDGFGQVQVSGPAALAGTLEVSLLNGFMPMAGDAFQILTAGGGRTGIFATEILPALSVGLNWDVQYKPDSVVLSVISAGLPGDYNQDGSVDAADYVVWRKNEGTTNPLPNDPIGGTIDADQYNQWRTHFGETGGGGSVASANATAPEPATLMMLMLAAVGWCLLRRRAA